jgi:hypothetical protein
LKSSAVLALIEPFKESKYEAISFLKDRLPRRPDGLLAMTKGLSFMTAKTKKILFYDTTLRDGSQAETSMVSARSLELDVPVFAGRRGQ